MKSYVLALDLEGTLISNAMSQIPWPGQAGFLNRCAELFPRIVMFTPLSRKNGSGRSRAYWWTRASRPPWFAEVEYITWQGETKNLRFVPGVHPHQVLPVDDFEKYVHLGQEAQWLQIEHFDHPYSSADTGLANMLNTLAARI